jgi:FixJ family two-component response regulator
MSKQKLLQRLVGCLAANEGVQPKRAEIWRRPNSLTPREVDVLCYLLGGQLNREIAAELGVTERTIKDQSSSRACHEKAWRAINCSIIPNGVALHSLARLAEIRRSQEVQKATAGESIRLWPVPTVH